MSDLSVPPTPGPVDFNNEALRYNDLADIKQRLGLETGDTTWDVQLTQAGVAAEVSLDAHLGRSFPDADAGLDADGNPPNPAAITVVPAAVSQVALAASVMTYQHASAPFGVSGSDSFALGAVNVPEIVRSEVLRNPLLVGLQVSWGVA